MALNATLLVEPEPSWGRTYVEHVEALAKDEWVPSAVRDACRAVLAAGAPHGDVIKLRTRRDHEAVMEAARDVIAHAWAVVRRHDLAKE